MGWNETGGGYGVTLVEIVLVRRFLAFFAVGKLCIDLSEKQDTVLQLSCRKRKIRNKAYCFLEEKKKKKVFGVKVKKWLPFKLCIMLGSLA